MYTKRILSVAATVAVMTTGAMAFDFKPMAAGSGTGYIVADVTASPERNASYTEMEANGTAITVTADANMTLSDNSKGDALIYPAFKTGSWDSEIVVRNSQNRAVVAKVVLYAADNSRELLDFDIYLSPYDVFRFNINKDRTLTTSDASFAKVDPTLDTDKYEFITEKTTIGALPDDVDSGYVVIYGMTQARKAGAYHAKHGKLFKDFRTLVNTCRDDDNDATTKASWRTVLGNNSSDIINGTAVDTNVTSPSILVGCETYKMKEDGDYNKSINAMDSNFTSVDEDALFGDVRISSTDGDKRDLLIKATAIDNYTTDNQMMLWVPGEYAAIQDRRLGDEDNNNRTDYNITGIEGDALDFITKTAYYQFDANQGNGANTILVTQPMKRALVMGGDRNDYWKAGSVGKSATANKWGEFSVTATYRDENEKVDVADTGLAVVISPVSGDPDAAYKNELQVFSNPERSETQGDEFKNNTVNGFAIMNLGTNAGLPAIVTQMTGSMVDGEGQINWIYSTTDKD